MQKIVFSMFMLSYVVLASVVVPDDYLISEDKKVSYLYTHEHSELMPMTKAYQEEVMETYEDEFGFALDDELIVGVASSKNQIANGYSTQMPFNSQVLYGAGATYIDYFSSVSWLKTLLIHETAHNYQLNPKENLLSKVSHHIVGNQAVSFLGFFPFFPIPNVLESSFNLEGNAVLNESRFGNGGRLFSGYAMAEVVTMAKAGKITPELMYNVTYEFPYNEKFYLIGGFFQQFLAQRYGMEKVNNYFKAFAKQAFPFFTNDVFEKHYGKNFEVLLAEFVHEVNIKHQGFMVTKGEAVVTSKVAVPLKRNANKIYTLIGDNLSENRVLEVDRATKKISFHNGTWRRGELFKIESQYYSQSSAKTSPTRIGIGVFDSEGYLKQGSEGKALQGITLNGDEVYFDIEKSIESPQVYVGDTFYTESHSSVHVNQNDLYYFKQKGSKRTLYKNREALTSFEGYYGFVVDVGIEGKVYFVATSKHGSTVYSVKNNVVKRVTVGDDVIDFKLINDKEALVVTIGADGYVYNIVQLEALETEVNPLLETPKQERSFSSLLKERPFLDQHTELESEAYSPFQELHYSVLDQALYYDEESGVGVNLRANFSDPLLQNSLALILSHNDDRDIVGLSYLNQQDQLEYGATIYAVSKGNESALKNKRDMGYNGYLRYPFLASGYLRANTTLAYNKDYNNIYREPLTLSLDVSRVKKFGVSKYINDLNALSLFGTSDREVNYFGGKYQLQRGLGWQSYIGGEVAYMKSNQVDFFNEKGIELRDIFTALQSDKATLYVPSFSNTSYAKELKMVGISFSKVFDLSLYSFSFPLSLQREAFYAKQRLYDIDFGNKIQRSYHETVIGTELELLFFHKLQLPFNIEWIHNKDVLDQGKVKFYFGVDF